MLHFLIYGFKINDQFQFDRHHVHNVIYTVMMSNVAYITTEVDESRDYATLHTAGNTEDSCQSKPVVCVGRGYNHLQRESVKSSIISSGDGHLSYSNIDSTAQYLVCVYNVMCLVLNAPWNTKDFKHVEV